MRRVKILILKKDKRKEEITLPYIKLCISTVVKIGTGGGKTHRSVERDRKSRSRPIEV